MARSPRCVCCATCLVELDLHGGEDGGEALQVLVHRGLPKANVLVLGVWPRHPLQPLAHRKPLHGCGARRRGSREADSWEAGFAGRAARQAGTRRSRRGTPAVLSPPAGRTAGKRLEHGGGHVGEGGARVQHGAVPLVKQGLRHGQQAAVYRQRQHFDVVVKRVRCQGQQRRVLQLDVARHLRVCEGWGVGWEKDDGAVRWGQAGGGGVQRFGASCRAASNTIAPGRTSASPSSSAPSPSTMPKQREKTSSITPALTSWLTTAGRMLQVGGWRRLWVGRHARRPSACSRPSVPRAPPCLSAHPTRPSCPGQTGRRRAACRFRPSRASRSQR